MHDGVFFWDCIHNKTQKLKREENRKKNNIIL